MLHNREKANSNNVNTHAKDITINTASISYITTRVVISWIGGEKIRQDGGQCTGRTTEESHFDSQKGQEIFLKNGIFWYVTPCGSCKNRRFGGT
jgi:hypothetical protein